MLVKDWLSVIGFVPNIEVVEGNTATFGTGEYVKENYGNFNLKQVEQKDDTDTLVLYVSEPEKCDCYRVRTVRKHLTEYEKGFYAALHNGIPIDYRDKEESYCIGTRECETCTCGGDKRKCDFYSAE